MDLTGFTFFPRNNIWLKKKKKNTTTKIRLYFSELSLCIYAIQM